MLNHMRTTLVIEDQIMKRLKALAAERGRTLSSLVEAFLRQGLEREQAKTREPLEPIPTFDVGRIKANVADRDELYRVMENRD